MAQFKEQWHKLESTFLTQSNRERWLILIVFWTVAAYLGMLLYEHTLGGALQDLQNEHHSQLTKIEAQQQQVLELNNSIALLTRQEREQEKQRTRLQARLTDFNKEIDIRMRTLVSPEQMSSLLLSILKQSNELKLQELSNLSPHLLTEPDDPDPLYRHGLSLTLEGSYLALLKYVELLEKLSGRIFWQGLEFELEAHPNAIIRLQFFTISQEKELLRG